MIDNTVLDANVVLLRSGTVIGYGGAVLGTLKLAVGSGIRLNAGDVLTATEYIGNIVSPPSNQVVVGCDGAENVSTQHNNNYRTGAYLHETTLTPAQILARGMRVKYAHSVDGYIHTQPLYIRNVDFKTGRANGLFLATTANKVYALNADTGIEKWSTPLLDSNPGQRGLGRVVSIGATPVIDVAGDRMYVLFSTKNEQKESANCPDSSHPDPKCWTYEDQLASLDVAYWLVVLDYRDGSELARVPVKASLYRSDGTSVTFTPKNQMDRAALLLDHGSVYLGFAARFAESIIEYHGWVLRYRARDLSFQGAFCTSRDATVQTDPFTQHKAEGAGIWQGGGGLAADADGNIYFLVGNGPADLFSYKFGDAFVKLTPSGNNLSSSAFIPSDPTSINKNCPNDPTKDCSNDPNTLYVKDVDLGAGGAMVLPKTKLVIGGGKTGYMYLLNKDDMTLRQQFAASTNLYSPPGTDLRWQDWDAGPHLHGSPTYWRGPDPTYGYLYVWGEKDYLRLYRFNTATQKIEEPNFRQGTALALENTMPGGMMSVSANGNAANSGVVWATLPEALFPGPVRLYAFHAETLQWLWDTRVPSPGHWVAPTIGDGKVFIATSSGEVIAYELSPKSNFPRPRQQKKPFQPQSPPGELPLAQRYPDEASIRALPIIALNALAPPQGLVRVAVLEGEATETYEAGETSETGAFAWQSTKTTAILRTIAGSGPEPPSRAVRVELLPGPVWHASDGSMARGTIEKGFPAPEKQDASWMLFKVTTAQGRGILGGAKYIQRVFTRGGAPPTAAPQQKGATVRVPYHARYVVYR